MDVAFRLESFPCRCVDDHAVGEGGVDENSLIGLQFQASGSHGRPLDAAVLFLPRPVIRWRYELARQYHGYPTLRRLFPPDHTFLFADEGGWQSS